MKYRVNWTNKTHIKNCNASDNGDFNYQSNIRVNETVPSNKPQVKWLVYVHDYEWIASELNYYCTQTPATASHKWLNNTGKE